MVNIKTGEKMGRTILTISVWGRATQEVIPKIRQDNPRTDPETILTAVEDLINEAADQVCRDYYTIGKRLPWPKRPK